MSKSKAMQQYAEIKKTIAEAVKAAEAVMKTAFNEAAKDLFTKYPEMELFSWTQYTPYFNDGEECVFRTQTGYPTIRFTDETEYDSNSCEGEADSERPEFEAVSEFLNIFETEDLKTIFGDHIRVTVNRDGTTSTEGYEHD